MTEAGSSTPFQGYPGKPQGRGTKWIGYPITSDKAYIKDQAYARIEQNMRDFSDSVAPARQIDFLYETASRPLTVPEYAALLALRDPAQPLTICQDNYPYPEGDALQEGNYQQAYWLVRRPFKLFPFTTKAVCCNIVVLDGLSDSIYEQRQVLPESDEDTGHFGSVVRLNAQLSGFPTTYHYRAYTRQEEGMESFPDIREILAPKQGEPLDWAKTIIGGLIKEVKAQQKMPPPAEKHVPIRTTEKVDIEAIAEAWISKRAKARKKKKS